ncbi:MAG: hypothetical protein EP341_09660 [Sphingomonadales bacterium]|nr:MAG: hypothetical protein EP341_09660 [Sphingomonadales bacterium]
MPIMPTGGFRTRESLASEIASLQSANEALRKVGVEKGKDPTPFIAKNNKRIELIREVLESLHG